MAPLESDPVTLATDESGDLIVPLRFATGLDAVVQGARVRMQLIRGEWFLDLDAGVPWMENDAVTETAAILGQKFNRSRVTTALRTAILSTPGVKEVLSLQVEFNGTTRAVTVTWSARAAFGDTPTDTLVISVEGA